MRRRQPRFAPTSGTAASVNPSGWEVRSFHPIQANPPVASPPALGHAQPASPSAPNWEVTQAYVDGRNVGHRSASIAREQMDEPTASQSPPERWVPVQPGIIPAIKPWQDIEPQIGQDDSAADFVPRRRRSIVWPLIIVMMLAGLGAVIALLIEQQRVAAKVQTQKTVAEQSARPQTGPYTIKAAMEVSPNVVLPPESKLSPWDASAQAEALLHKLTAAKTLDERVACLADGQRHRDSVESYFTALSSPLEIKDCKGFPSSVKALPSGLPMILCEVTTNLPTSPLTRLVSSEDGSFKLDWNLLHDSISGLLTSYSKAPHADPQWISIGLRRNFGFDEPESVRQAHYVFDIQGTGDGSDRTIALAVKDSPTGRALNQAIGWNQLYIVRTLLHYATIEGRERLVIVDAELLPSGDNRL